MGSFGFKSSIADEQFGGRDMKPQRRKARLRVPPRLRRVSSNKEMESGIDNFVRQGCAILIHMVGSALLRKFTCGSGGGHLLWALLTVRCPLGLGNSANALFAQYTEEQILVKLEKS